MATKEQQIAKLPVPVYHERELATGWWRTRSGSYVRILHNQYFDKPPVCGFIYQEDGTPLMAAGWKQNGDSYVDRKFDLMNRKMGDKPQGWPEWTKE
jgi:hypothetical protein